MPLPRPGYAPEEQVRCPSCGHDLDAHHAEQHEPKDPVPTNASGCTGCLCRWTPNDIALAFIFGDLTRRTG